MSYIVARIALVILIPIMLFTDLTNAFKEMKYKNCEITGDSKKELLEFLEIEEAPSFRFIHKKGINTHEAYDKCIELKFEISKKDYQKNELAYGEEWQEMLLDCHYIEKEENDKYICVVRYTDIYNKECYQKLSGIKVKYEE